MPLVNVAFTIASFFKRVSRESFTVFSIYNAETEELEECSSEDFRLLCNYWREQFAHSSSEIVPIFGRTEKTVIAAYFAAMLVDKLPVFISFPSVKISAEDYQKKLSNYLKQFQSDFIVGTAEDKQHFGEGVRVCEDLESTEPTQLVYLGNPSKPLFLQCTSGSTGLQKSVAITAEMLECQIENYGKAISLSEKDSVVSWLPLYHDMGLIATLFLPLLRQIPVYFLDTFAFASSPGVFLHLIDKVQGTLCWQPNFAFSYLASLKHKSSLQSVRLFVNCAEPVSKSSFEKFRKAHGVRLEQMSACYALAEGVFAVSQSEPGKGPSYLRVCPQEFAAGRIRPSEGGREISSCGAIIPGVKVRIKSQPDEDVGELEIFGPSVVPGYYRGEEIANDGWFPTGDLGFLYDDELYICGRIKDLIIHRGKNIYPHDLEAIIDEHSGSHSGRCVVFGMANEELGSEDLVALYEPQVSSSRSELDEISDELGTQIRNFYDVGCEVYAVPKKWLSKTSSGKISRRANCEKFIRARGRAIHVYGDSHLRLLWKHCESGKRSYVNEIENVHAHWWGVVYSGNWRHFERRFFALREELSQDDELVLSSGEPECRTVFPAANDPEKAISEAIDSYSEYFSWIRKNWQGGFSYLTGPPTNATLVGPPEVQEGEHFPIIGTPAKRYALQAEFYRQMSELCSSHEIRFLDACSPWLEGREFLDSDLLAPGSSIHLDQTCKNFYLDLFENTFGFVSRFSTEDMPVMKVWNGTFEHFTVLLDEEITKILGRRDDRLSYDELSEQGLIDSLSFVSILSWIEQSFDIEIKVEDVRPADFSSSTSLFVRFLLPYSCEDREQFKKAAL